MSNAVLLAAVCATVSVALQWIGRPRWEARRFRGYVIAWLIVFLLGLIIFMPFPWEIPQ
jgi:hypothetical protein